MLRHKSAAMTLNTYTDLFDDDLDAVPERLDSAAVDARAASVRHRASLTPASLPSLPYKHAL
jgi:hypothetical protein